MNWCGLSSIGYTFGVAKKYDVIVVGAGHAGCEAAGVTARRGLSTLVVTLRADRVGWMSCNPAIGGVGKGNLVREVDALGGLMGVVTDSTAIQLRTLNGSRGLAVRGSRAQCDRRLYAATMRESLARLPDVEIREGLVERLIVEGGNGISRRIAGVGLESGEEIHCEAVILTTGTFLDGVAHVGRERFQCGREGEKPAVALSSSLRELGLSLGRFKTGTTPRLDGRTINLDAMEEQPGDEAPRPFSFQTDPSSFPVLPQRPCHVTRTNERTHAVIRESIHESVILRLEEHVESTRYCPSIEEKVRRFSDKLGHTVYIEPDGLDTDEVYPAGLSTSLPLEVQERMLRTIKGLEEVEIVRPGYAIEYDYLIPTQLDATLQVREIEGLFSAGQINGTSGYEEAAAQGLMAGANAALRLLGEPKLVLARDQAYVGVLVSDLTTVGASEPYRMFTSRSEHRLRLREDNADIRLCEEGHRLGLVGSGQLELVEARRRRIAAEVARLESTVERPRKEEGGKQARVTLATILRRPGVRYRDLTALDPCPDEGWSSTDADTVEAEVRYAGYIARSRRWLDRLRELEGLEIPGDFCVDAVPGLSNEVREKLAMHRPSTVGQASRIEGVTPAAVDILAASLLRLSSSCG